MKTRPSGGEFDPVSAVVYRSEATQLDSGEAAKARLVPFLTTRIKSPRGLFTQERSSQGHAQSVSDLAIEVRNEGGGDRLTAAMKIVHRGRSYEIRGTLRIDWHTGTTIYQCVEQNDFVPQTRNGCTGS